MELGLAILKEENTIKLGVLTRLCTVIYFPNAILGTARELIIFIAEHTPRK